VHLHAQFAFADYLAGQKVPATSDMPNAQFILDMPISAGSAVHARWPALL
jgi:hypothetical protein